MSKKIDFDKSLGDFVADYPQSRDVFEKFNLDYCCGGQKNIVVAATEKNIDLDEFKFLVQKAIDEAPKKQRIKKWSNESLINIIDHIEKKHHVFTWDKLASSSLLLNKLVEVHGPKHGDFLSKLRSMFSEFKLKLEKHLLVEEDIVFNYIRILESSFGLKRKKSYSDPRFTIEVIDILNKEHEDAAEILTKMRDFTSNYKLPDYACKTFAKLYQDLQALEDDLHEHIHLENTILLPRIKKLINQIDF